MDSKVDQWQAGCNETLKNLKIGVENAKQKIHDAMPENLPQTKKLLSPFLNVRSRFVLHPKKNRKQVDHDAITIEY